MYVYVRIFSLKEKTWNSAKVFFTPWSKYICTQFPSSPETNICATYPVTDVTEVKSKLKRTGLT